MGEGLSWVFITANFIKNRAAVQEETELLNQKSAQGLNASVQGGFVYSGNVIPHHSCCFRSFNVGFIHAHSH